MFHLFHKVALCSLALFIFTANCQVSTKVRPQPPKSLVSSLQVVQDCCEHLDDVVKLMACSNSSLSMSPPYRSRVSLVTYLDSDEGQFNIPDIFKFGGYMLANTASYAELHGYSFRWLSKATGSNHQPGDARWNKVKIIDEALDPVNGWAKDSEYFVWLDADAIVLDMGLKIEEVGKQYPQADFICSADIRQGLLNSGFLVMRNTKWLRAFVKEWWEVVDRSVKCDQDAFDVLYERYVEDANIGKHWRGDVRTKVAVLARDALNSDPPAMSHQKDYNQVLHLMGEVTHMREIVFNQAFSKICNSKTDITGRLPPQLGITQPFLLQTAEKVYSSRTTSLIESAKLRQGVEDFNALSVSVHHLSDIYKQLGLMKKHADLFAEVYQMTMEWRENFERELSQKGSSITSDDINTYVQLLKRVAENSNDYFQSLSDTAHMKIKEEVATSTLEILNRLFENVGMESKPFARHMSALMLTNLGEMYFDAWVELGERQGSSDGEHLLQLIVDKQNLAVNYFHEYLENVDNKSIQNEYSLAIQLLAIAYCSQNDIVNGRSNWAKAIEKSVKLVGGAEIGPYYSSLSRLYFNAALCDMKGNFFIEAKDKLLKMMVVVINSGQMTEAEINAKPFKGPPEIRMALSMLQEISLKDPASRQGISFDRDIEEEWEDCEVGEEGCEEVFINVDAQHQDNTPELNCDTGREYCYGGEEDSELIDIAGQVRHAAMKLQVKNMQELDEEYEECFPGEEGCEELEVEIVLEEDEDDVDELRELAEIRAQYARQSRSFIRSNGDGERDDKDDYLRSSKVVQVHSIQELDEDYEECFPGEEGCEELEVEIVVDGGSGVLEVDEDDEDELRELAEIRAQYARQSRSFIRSNGDDERGDEDYYLRSSKVVQVHSIQELDEDYEECFPGEEGCEELEVEIIVDGEGGVLEVDEDDEDELRELAEIRAQYARQSRSFIRSNGDDERGDEDYYLRSSKVVQVHSIQELDEDYEECFPGEEGCEELEVEIIVDGEGGVLEVDEDDEDELRELAEIRAQYARQSRSFIRSNGDDERGDEDYYLRSSKVVQVHSIQELDEDYEECFPGEEGCEELEVEIIVDGEGGVLEVDEDDEDELRELAEIRAQYARQSRSFIRSNGDDERGDKDHLRSSKVVQVHSIQELDEDYEECFPGEEGCEELEVDIIIDGEGGVLEVDEDDEDELRELAEIRAQYARQSKEWQKEL